MQIIIGLIIAIGLIYFFIKRKESKTQQEQQEQKKDLFNVSSQKINDNTTQITIDLNEKEFIKSVSKKPISTKNIEKTIEDVAGFYGTKDYSPNKEYCATYNSGYSENGKHVLLIKDKILLFKKKIHQLTDCHVSNDGVVVCCDWKDSDELNGQFLVFDKTGEKIFSKKTTANLETCAISANSKIALFETLSSKTPDSDKIFIVDIEEKKVIQKIERQNSLNNVIIDTDNKTIKFKDHKGFRFEIDFEGHQTNREDYENQILTKGSVYDRIWLYVDKPNDIKFKDEKYLELLNQALTDNDASYSLGKDRIYRMIGEYYEACGNTEKTMENWDKAMQINPKIGLKRRLEVLKKSIK